MGLPVIQQEFVISTDYYGQDVSIEINGVDFTNCAAQTGKSFGDGLVTDPSTGRLSGQLIIVNTLGLDILTKPGTVNINFVVRTPVKPNSYSIQARTGQRVFQEQEGDPDFKIIIATLPMKIIGPGEPSRTPIVVDQNQTTNVRDNGLTNTATSSTNANNSNFLSSSVSPLAQTFYVDGTIYKNGIFATSAEIYFYQKSSTIGGDVKLELREVIDGLPSNRIVDGSLAFLGPSSINVNADATGNLTSTKFKFSNPIYLFPGKEYALCVKTPDENYTILVSRVGELTTVTGANTLSSKSPNVGKLYKMTNSGAQTEDTGASLLFTINKAVFQTGTKSFVKQTTNINPARFNYGVAKIFVGSRLFGDDTVISTELQSKDTLGSTVAYELIPYNSAKRLNTLRTLNETGDAKVKVLMTNKDKNISPVINLSTLNLVTMKDEIDSLNDQSIIRNSEVVYSNGFGKAKYLSKVVTLSPDFDSTGIEVKLEVNRKNNTDIDVFCRVKSSFDNSPESSIEKRNWVLMPLYSAANSKSTSGVNFSIVSPTKISVGTDSTTFIPETYRILETDSANLAYSANIGGVVTTFNNFNQFQVKIVMYGDTTNNYSPKVRNLYATAVI